MNLAEAVETVAQYVRDTQSPLSDAVRKVWEQITPLPDEHARQLMQEALAQRAGVLLRHPVVESRGAQEISVSVERRPMERHEVSVEVLVETIYHVNGEAKAIASFTLFDVRTKLSSVRAIEMGVSRHRQMWEHVAERLSTCKKNKVEDLAHGEQMKIARMVFDLQHSHALPEISRNAIA